MSPGQGAASELTKAEIRQLLKDLSGEIQRLQEDLAKQRDLPQPEAGTTTDPGLYDGASPEAPLPPGAGNRTPISLGADDRASSSKGRPNAGRGRPSGQVSDLAPQLQPESSALSDHPDEESAIDRQAIPPEYQPVFERLKQPQDDAHGQQ